MEEVVALKFGMVLNHPMVIRADVGFQNGGGYIGMVCGAQCIAYVMEQSADAYSSSLPSLWARVAVCGQWVSRSTGNATIPCEQGQMFQQPGGQSLGMVGRLAADSPVLSGSLFHVMKLRGWFASAVAVLSCLLPMASSWRGLRRTFR